MSQDRFLPAAAVGPGPHRTRASRRPGARGGAPLPGEPGLPLRSRPGSGTLGAILLAGLLVSAGCGQGVDLEQPTPLYGETPIDYPIALWDEGVEGTTVLRLRVTDTGAVDSVEVAETSGHLGLDSAAVAGARDLRFQPGRRNGKRVRMWASLPVHFSTRPRSSDER